MTTAPIDVLSIPVEDRPLHAFRAAVADVIEEHARLGLPLYIWRDGKVVAVPAEELRAQNQNQSKQP
jgi:hypothetical protein